MVKDRSDLTIRFSQPRPDDAACGGRAYALGGRPKEVTRSSALHSAPIGFYTAGVAERGTVKLLAAIDDPVHGVFPWLQQNW